MPIIVFASESSSCYSLGEALLMENFLTIFMSVFVFLPLSKIIESNGGILKDKIENTDCDETFLTRRYWIKRS